MPTGSTSIIVIGGGGGNRTQANYSTPYPVVAGDTAENTAIGGPSVEVTFTDNNLLTTDIYLAAGQKYTFGAAGAIVVQP